MTRCTDSDAGNESWTFYFFSIFLLSSPFFLLVISSLVIKMNMIKRNFFFSKRYISHCRNFDVFTSIHLWLSYGFFGIGVVLRVLKTIKFADWDTLIISLENFSLLIDKLTVAFCVCFFTHTRFMLPDGHKAALKKSKLYYLCKSFVSTW